jgi:hypothetical protein
MGEKYQGLAIISIIIAVAVTMLLLAEGVACAGEPLVNRYTKRHPALTAAQRLSRQAYDKMVAAKHANEWDMKGHARRAKDLLEQANEELMLAAETAPKGKGK